MSEFAIAASQQPDEGPRGILGFAHRGGMAHARENTLEAFVNAVHLGARAVETDVYVTRDGYVVLDHDGVVRYPDGREVDIADVDRIDLPAHIPTLAEFYAACGTGLAISIDVRDDDAAALIVAEARATGGEAAVANLWLCHPDVDTLISWRRFAGAAHLVHSAEDYHLQGGMRSHVRRLALAGIDVLNLCEPDVANDTADICHAAGVLLFGWNAHDTRRIDRLLAAGVDGIYSNDVGLMIAGVARSGAELA